MLDVCEIPFFQTGSLGSRCCPSVMGRTGSGRAGLCGPWDTGQQQGVAFVCSCSSEASFQVCDYQLLKFCQQVVSITHSGVVHCSPYY